MANLKPTGRNLILDSLINEQHAVYGFANRTLSAPLIAGQPYVLTANGRVVDGEGTLRVYIYLRDWSESNIVEISSKEETTKSVIVVPKKGGEYVMTVYSFLAQQTAGGNVHINWVKLELGTEATPWTPAPEDNLSGGGVNNMILALNTITLTTVTDIQGIYRYYYLGTSKPSVPSAYPPPSPWVSTEPNFDLSNQGSLYYIDCTLFSDLSYDYGDVQISSDYEAVKQTYADALQQIEEAKKELNSSMQKKDDLIRTEVSETYYSKEDTNTKLGEISSAMEQTAKGFELQFKNFQTNLNNINADQTSKFNELYKYIRFVGGSIELGDRSDGSANITLTIENDRISFKQAGQEIAYLSNNQLYITDANVANSMIVGDFIFVPRPDKSLDFKKRSV